MKKIGVVGLGIMGSGIATNFLKKGHEVFVWNRNSSVAARFVEQGAVMCASPAVVAQKAEIVFEVTANDESSKQVWFSETGILAGASTETILVASATLSIQWVDELIKETVMRKFQFFDMALTGGRIGAETGTLTLLCGGDGELLKTIENDLASIATKVLYFGVAGQGMRYKLILNFIQATHIVAFGQALKIAQAYNMDLKKVGDALAERPGGVITNLAWRDYQTEPEPINFSIEWITKDLKYAKALTKDLDIALIDEVLAEYQKALENGFGKKDWARVTQLNQRIPLL